MTVRNELPTSEDEEPNVIRELQSIGDDGSNALLLRLNRPNQLNAIDWPTVLELDEALKAADEDASIRCVLLIGEGRAFSAGGDLKSYLTLQRDPVAFPRFLEDFHRTCSHIHSSANQSLRS